jgi:hypothetical protein
MKPNNPIDAALNPQLRHILEVFGRKPETGKTPLESLPPSQRLVANAVLNAREWMVIHWGDMRFHEKKSVPKNDPIKQTGHSGDILETSHHELPQPRKKTLTEVLRERGIKDAPADDPIYQTRFELRLRAPLPKPISTQPQSSEGTGKVIKFRKRLINRNSTNRKDRDTWIRCLATLASAMSSPKEIVVARVRVALLAATWDNVDWRDLYATISRGLADRYPDPPSIELVNPEKQSS